MCLLSIIGFHTAHLTKYVIVLQIAFVLFPSPSPLKIQNYFKCRGIKVEKTA